MMGNLEQKMHIAFRCYDKDGDEIITVQEIKVILKNIPVYAEARFGNSFKLAKGSLSRSELAEAKKHNDIQIDLLCDALLQEFPDGLYFDEFFSLATDVTSELFLSIYDCLYHNIPCVKNFLLLRRNYLQFLQSSASSRV